MAGIGFASVDTDVSSVVNAVFDELECCALPHWEGEHSGQSVAFFDCHGCLTGMLCQQHYDLLINCYMPIVNQFTNIQCTDCGKTFHSTQEVYQVYPL